MNASDAARLELAKRAYRATEPTDMEVQRGVRRARLALRRGKPRRHLLSKGLVMVVLAIGGLAYAKPHTLREVVSNFLERGHATGRLNAGGFGPSVTPPPERHAVSEAKERDSSVNTESTTAESAVASSSAVRVEARSGVEADLGTGKSRPTTRDSLSRSAPPVKNADTSHMAAAESGPQSAASEWGKVGRALAANDEQAALSALSELSESGDAGTRDKADLGRAQLMFSHGQKAQACELARDLVQRQTEGRIERQAQTLLKNCAR